MANAKKVATELVAAKNLEAFNALTTTASKVRYLLADGKSRGDIARFLGIRYQWVRNIEITPLKKA